MAKEIPLKTIDGSVRAFVIVDESDYESLNQWQWHFSKGYACRTVNISGKKSAIQMHRLIMNAPNNMDVDHINGNSLDNRRINLRIGTRANNICNRGVVKNNPTSKYKGVCWYKKGGLWASRISSNGNRTHIGYFDSEIDAAKAYDEKAKELHGEFAWLNFPKKEQHGS